MLTFYSNAIPRPVIKYLDAQASISGTTMNRLASMGMYVERVPSVGTPIGHEGVWARDADLGVDEARDIAEVWAEAVIDAEKIYADIPPVQGSAALNRETGYAFIVDYVGGADSAEVTIIMGHGQPARTVRLHKRDDDGWELRGPDAWGGEEDSWASGAVWAFNKRHVELCAVSIAYLDADESLRDHDEKITRAIWGNEGLTAAYYAFEEGNWDWLQDYILDLQGNLRSQWALVESLRAHINGSD